MDYKICENFFTKEECEKYINYIEQLPRQGYHKDRYDQFDMDFSQYLYEKVKEYLPDIKAGSGRITFLRYNDKSSGMRVHKDQILEPNVKYTGIIYLNDLEDGETILYERYPIKVNPREGRLLLFNVNMYHKACPPEKVKYAILFRLKN